MKKFSHFIQESRGSRAAAEAQRMGWVSDAHGSWVDRQGNLKAKTIKGQLVIIKKKSPSPEKQSTTAPERKQNIRAQEPQTPGGQRLGVPPPQEAPPAPEPENETPLTIIFGKFNPPTIGHEKLIQKGKQISSGGDFKIYPSRTVDPAKNPLNPDQKIKYMRKMFPDYAENIINNEDMKTIFDVLVGAQEDGYKKINIVVGADRLSEFERLAKQYNGQLYDFSEINVLSAGARDPDAQGVEAASSSKLRKAAAENDYNTFRVGVPKKMKPKDSEALFHAVQKKMLGEQKTFETWEIAPSLDFDGLREQYYDDNIFKIDDVVESLNTGLVGKVTRRGPNYLICVTENNIMFKSWIKDLKEWTDVSGVSAAQREVGTPELLKYAMKMTGTEEIKNFLSNFRKSKSHK